MVHRRSAAAFLVALALLIGACGGEDERAFPPFVGTSPIEDLLGVPIDPLEASRWDDALSQVAITNCMADQGIEYVADPTLLWLRTTNIMPGAAGVDPELARIDSAQSMLNFMEAEYRVALLPEDEQAATRALFDPNAAAKDTPERRDAYWAALSGTAAGPGCLQESESAPLADPNRDGGLIAQFEQALAAEYARDAAVLQGEAAWPICMAAAGHDYVSPGDAQQKLRGQAANTSRLTDDEIESGDGGSLAVQERIIAELEVVAALEADVARASQVCAEDWFAARAAARARVADDFVDRFG